MCHAHITTRAPSGASNEDIARTIDRTVPPILAHIRAKHGLGAGAFIIPADVHDYLYDAAAIDGSMFARQRPNTVSLGLETGVWASERRRVFWRAYVDTSASTLERSIVRIGYLKRTGVPSRERNANRYCGWVAGSRASSVATRSATRTWTRS